MGLIFIFPRGGKFQNMINGVFTESSSRMLLLGTMVKPIDAHPIVTEGEKPRPGIEWQVINTQ
jgi:hypothetical protein